LNIKKYILLITAFCMLLLSAGCGLKSTPLQEVTGERFYMDTLIQIKVYSEDAARGQQALDLAFAAFERIDHAAGRFQKAGNDLPDANDVSDVVKINQNAGNKPVQVSVDTQKIIQRANYFAALCGGAFDITIGPVMDLWGFGHGSQLVPADEQLSQALTLVDYQKVQVDPVQKTVFLSLPGMVMDLGGVAKGYATDEAVEALKEAGIRHAIINAGGNVYALGTKPDGSPWRVGVQDPRNTQEIIAVLAVSDRAVVSSGDYQRFFEQDGNRYHHILDPATGKPAGQVMQTTVVTDSAMDADILSTTLFVLGPQNGLDFVQGLPTTEAIFVGLDKQINYTEGLSAQLEFTGGGDYKTAD
jgi:thiamine biosynthesis lipoprotein